MRFPLSLSLSPFRVGFVIIISRHPFFIFFSNSLAFVPLCSWPRHVNQPARYQRPLVLIDQALDRRQWFENTRMHSGVKGGYIKDTPFMAKVESDFQFEGGSTLYALHRLSRNEIWCGVLLHFPVDFAGRMMGILF